MHGLSNFFRRHALSQPTVRCRPAEPSEIHLALRLILSADGRPAGNVVVAEFLRYAVRQKLPLSDIWVTEMGGQVRWAVFPVSNPGRTVLLLTPGQANDLVASSAEQLIQTLCEHQALRGIHLAQALVDPGAKRLAALYGACGFEQIAELVYLQVHPRDARAPDLPQGWSWRTYSSARHALFRRAILASYIDSLDCPGLSGMRDIEDVIDGHRATGIHDPALWFVLVHADQPLAVLLLSVTAPGEAMELVYLGLDPLARGKGVGDLVMRQALSAAHLHGAGALTLAVDARNHPAMKLYFRHGFSRLGSKLALMRDLRGMGAASTARAPVVR